MRARLVNRCISVEDARLLATLTELRKAIVADQSRAQARKQRPRRLINYSYTTADIESCYVKDQVQLKQQRRNAGAET